jgi:hypothetical protein
METNPGPTKVLSVYDEAGYQRMARRMAQNGKRNRFKDDKYCIVVY